MARVLGHRRTTPYYTAARRWLNFAVWAALRAAQTAKKRSARGTIFRTCRVHVLEGSYGQRLYGFSAQKDKSFARLRHHIPFGVPSVCPPSSRLPADATARFILGKAVRGVTSVLSSLG